MLTWIAAALVVLLVISLYQAFPALRDFDRAFTEWVLGARPEDRL